VPRPQLGLVGWSTSMVSLRSTRLFSALIASSLVAACGSDSSSPADDGNGSGSGPAAPSTIPSSTGAGVALNVKIAATFSAAMDPATITAATFTVHQGSAAVPGTVTYSG